MLDARFDKSFGSFHLDVAFTAETGSTTALLGESGSGKSMILRMLAGLTRPDTGHFSLDGVTYLDTARKYSTPTQERPIGYVFQEYVLFPHLSVFDNVAFGLRMQKTPHDVIRRRVAEALGQVHLVGYDDRKPGQLSGGQQQRVAIARALALKPTLLLLDESLSALDIQTRREVQQELRGILADAELTAVMVSHQYLDALLFGDQIMVLERGRAIQMGQHLELVSRPQSPYIAEMVGVNLLRGRIAGETPAGLHLVAVGANDTSLSVLARALEGAASSPLRRDHDVSVAIDPRNVDVQRSEPNRPGGNVLRGEVLQIVPISATYSSTGGRIEGLVRVSLNIDPALPPLRADIPVTDTASLNLSEGQPAYATFAPNDARIYA